MWISIMSVPVSNIISEYIIVDISVCSVLSSRFGVITPWLYNTILFSFSLGHKCPRQFSNKNTYITVRIICYVL